MNFIHKRFSLRFWTLICKEAKKRDLYHSEKMDEAFLNGNKKSKAYHREQMRRYIKIHDFAHNRKERNEGLIKDFLDNYLCKRIDTSTKEGMRKYIRRQKKVYGLFDRFIRYPFSWFIEQKMLESELCQRKIKDAERRAEYETPKWLKDEIEERRERAKGSSVTAKTEEELMDKLESAMDVRNDYDKLNRN